LYEMARIHIVGGPGSGKTTLARRLDAEFGVAAYDLDTFAYEGGAGCKRDLDMRRTDVARLADTPRWVTDGIYLWWCDPLAQHADVIVWLDVAWRVALFRIVRRHVVRSLAGDNPHRGVRKLMRFVWHTRRYYVARKPETRRDDGDDGAITRIATRDWLTPHAAKVRRCRGQRDLERVIAELRTLS
jgi:adenylate kinase family enzyme